MKAGTRERIDVHPTHWREWHGRDIFDGAGTEERSEKRDGG